jgi:NTP pyrophosphatase (non-canonical NTP hydrolase)
MSAPNGPKTLEKMEAEVVVYCRAKGWYDQEVSIPTVLALLHEETAEAGRAWRDHGLEDATPGVTPETPDGSWKAKPQGVGSELADVLIRLLDDSGRYKLSLPEAFRGFEGSFAFSEDFLDNINTLHNLICRASMAWEGEDYSAAALAPELAKVMAFTVQLARFCGIEIFWEYERKMQYNHTREYRHGGRRA